MADETEDDLNLLASAARDRVERYCLDRERDMARARVAALVARGWNMDHDFLSAKAKLQPRDMKGRWIDMGATVRWLEGHRIGGNEQWKRGKVLGFDAKNKKYTISPEGGGPDLHLEGKQLEVVKAAIPDSPDEAKKLEHDVKTPDDPRGDLPQTPQGHAVKDANGDEVKVGDMVNWKRGGFGGTDYPVVDITPEGYPVIKNPHVKERDQLTTLSPYESDKSWESPTVFTKAEPDAPMTPELQKAIDEMTEAAKWAGFSNDGYDKAASGREAAFSNAAKKLKKKGLTPELIAELRADGEKSKAKGESTGYDDYNPFDFGHAKGNADAADMLEKLLPGGGGDKPQDEPPAAPDEPKNDPFPKNWNKDWKPGEPDFLPDQSDQSDQPTGTKVPTEFKPGDVVGKDKKTVEYAKDSEKVPGKYEVKFEGDAEPVTVSRRNPWETWNADSTPAAPEASASEPDARAELAKRAGLTDDEMKDAPELLPATEDLRQLVHGQDLMSDKDAATFDDYLDEAQVAPEGRTPAQWDSIQEFIDDHRDSMNDDQYETISDAVAKARQEAIDTPDPSAKDNFFPENWNHDYGKNGDFRDFTDEPAKGDSGASSYSDAKTVASRLIDKFDASQREGADWAVPKDPSNPSDSDVEHASKLQELFKTKGIEAVAQELWKTYGKDNSGGMDWLSEWTRNQWIQTAKNILGLEK